MIRYGGRKKGYKPVRPKWIAVLVLALVTGLITGLKYIPWVSEYVFTRGFSRAWIFVFGHISSVFPFSLFEVFILLAVAGVLYCIVRWIICACKKDRYRFKHSFVNFVLLLAVGLTLYNTVAAPAYLRASFAEGPQYESEILEEGRVREFAEWYYGELNMLATKFDHLRNDKNEIRLPYSYDGLASNLAKEYARFDGGYLSPYTPRAKQSFLKFMWRDFRVSGVTFAPLGECVVVNDQPPLDLVQTTAHELAHLKGVMNEGKANLLSYYVLFNAEDDFIRYCGMAWHVGYINRMLESKPELKEFAEQLQDGLHKGVTADNSAWFDYWRGRPSVFGKISGFFNNLYLKLSGLKEGTGSYYNQGGDVTYEPPPGYDPDVDGDDVDYIPVIREYSNIEKMLIAVYLSRTGQAGTP